MATQIVYQKINMKIEYIKNYNAGGIWLKLAVTNNSAEAVCINADAIGLNAGFSNDMFLVKRNGKDVEYKGVMKTSSDNYSAPMISILPKQRLIVTVDLSGDYDFSVPGKYEISYDFPNRSNCGSRSFYADLKSNLIQFNVK
jgi:hypothetical protein